MSELLGELRTDLTLSDKEYRHTYANERLNALVATQIKVLREQRVWRQEDLAEEAEMHQPMISRYENVNYSSWSIKTLKQLALAFDVILEVKFRSFGDMVRGVDEFSRESLQVPRFADDPFFKVAHKVSRPRIRTTAQTVRRPTPFVVGPRETGATQLPFQWDLVGGSDLRPQLVNSSPRPQGNIVIDRIMQATIGTGRSYATR
jgi:transcriptional regulator with XRE-family HTH domain